MRLGRPGAFEGGILVAMQGVVFRGGGDDAGNEFIIGPGAGALLCRYFTGRRHLDAEDQITPDFAGAYPRTTQRLAGPASNDRRDSIRPRTYSISTGFPMASMSCSTCCS